jgi:hypothetical protein
MNKFLGYFNLYDIRPTTAQYLWTYLLMKDKLAHNGIFIINEDYVNADKERWEYNEGQQKYAYSIRNNSYNEYVLPKRVRPIIPSQALTEELNFYKSQYKNEANIIRNLVKEHNIIAGLLWRNDAFFEDTMSNISIPVIHAELGALREPYFKNSVYIDFKGVNGSTEFWERFQNYMKLSKFDRLPLLTREELIETFSNSGSTKYLLNTLHNPLNTYDIGVPLQVEMDTNVILYNNNITLFDIVNIALRESSKVLVRNHPLAVMQYNGNINNATLDDSINSLDFISKCRKLYTLNSSVGFEALLLNKDVTFFGDSPFSKIPLLNEEDKLEALNFACFCYLVPYKSFLNEDYLNFRVFNKGNELEIAKYNRKMWLDNV